MAFDLLILDVTMPGESGLELALSVRAGLAGPHPDADRAGESSDRIAGLELGADDYLPKPFEPRELLLRVSALLRRAAPVARQSAGPVKMGTALYDPEGARLTKGGRPVKLTSAEAALLQLFAANAGHAFSAATSVRGWACLWSVRLTCR